MSATQADVKDKVASANRQIWMRLEDPQETFQAEEIKLSSAELELLFDNEQGHPDPDLCVEKWQAEVYRNNVKSGYFDWLAAQVN
ncbi:hypothetical protein ACI2KR_27060 [Pseudomonas luteola]